MRTLAEYLALVPPYNAQDANFMAELSLVLAPFVDQQAFLASLPAAFSVGEAIGVQLDAVGAWVGCSREIPVPVENPWFSWGTPGLGWGQGYWYGPYEGTQLSVLDDETFRRLIYAKILANNCNGLGPSIQAALAEYLSVYSGLNVFVIDQTDYPPNRTSTNLVIGIGISGTLPNVVDLAILQQWLIPVKPAGMGVQWGVTTVAGAPVFGWGVENEFISGWGVGAWGATPDYVAENVVT
jgi:hypothetical protein